MTEKGIDHPRVRQKYGEQLATVTQCSLTRMLHTCTYKYAKQYTTHQPCFTNYNMLKGQEKMMVWPKKLRTEPLC